MRVLPLLLVLAGCAAPETAAPVPPTEASLVCDRDYLPALRELVRSAESELRITQWELFPSGTTSAVEDLLVEAVDRDVHVRLLMDETVEQNAAAVQRLRDRGVDARLDTRTNIDVHAKALVADGAEALVGSTNWSSASIDYNHECNLRLRRGTGPAYVAAWFDALWESTATRPAPELAQEGPTTALVDDDLLPSLLGAVGGASERIDFTLYATYLQPTNPDAPASQVFQALADAAGRGVVVRGVADWSDWNDWGNEHNGEAVDWLRARGVQMRWEDPSINTHAKTFRIDGALQVQSANVSSGGFRDNHEVGAITREAEPLADFDAWFEALWDASSEEPEGGR